MWLNEDVNHVAVLVHSPPQIVALALNLHEKLIQVPGVAEATLSPLQLSSVLGTELLAPLTNGLAGDGDPAL